MTDAMDGLVRTAAPAMVTVSVAVFPGRTIEMELPTCALIADIKARLHRELGVPPSRQRLCRGATASSGLTLAEFSGLKYPCFDLVVSGSEAPVREEAVLDSVDSAQGISCLTLWRVPLVPLVACVDEPRDARTEPLISAICNGGRWRTWSASTVFIAYSHGPVQVVRHGNISGPRKQIIEGTDGPVGQHGLCALWDSDADDVEAWAFVVAYTDGTLKLCRREGGAAGALYVASTLLSTGSESEVPTVLRAREAGAATVHVLGKPILFVSSSGSFVDIWVRGASGDGASSATATGAGRELESEAAFPSVVRAGRLHVHESSAAVSAMQFFADGRLACGCSDGAFTVWDLAAAVRVGSDEAVTLDPVARVALPAGILELPLFADDVMGIFCIGLEPRSLDGRSLFEWRDTGSAGGCLRRRVGGLVCVSGVRLTRGGRRVVATSSARDEQKLLMWLDGVANEAAKRKEEEETEPDIPEFTSASELDGVLRQCYLGCSKPPPWDAQLIAHCRKGELAGSCGVIALADGSVFIGSSGGFVSRFYFINPTGSLVSSGDRDNLFALKHLAPSAQLTSRGSQLLACALPHGAVLLADKRAVERVCVVREASPAALVLATWSAQRDRHPQCATQSDAAAPASGAAPAGAAEPSARVSPAAVSTAVKRADGSAVPARVDGEALLRSLGWLPRGAMAELYLQLRGV